MTHVMGALDPPFCYTPYIPSLPRQCLTALCHIWVFAELVTTGHIPLPWQRGAHDSSAPEVLSQHEKEGGEVWVRDGKSRVQPGCNSGIRLMTWPGCPPQHQAAPAPCSLLVQLPPFLSAPCCLPKTLPPEAASPRQHHSWGADCAQGSGLSFNCIILSDDRRARVGDGTGAFLLTFAVQEM